MKKLTSKLLTGKGWHPSVAGCGRAGEGTVLFGENGSFSRIREIRPTGRIIACPDLSGVQTGGGTPVSVLVT